MFVKLNIKNSLLFLVLVLFLPSDAIADRGLDGIKPNKTKENKCWQLVKRYGAISHRINNDWYGKGAMRPSLEHWSLVRIKKPNWLLGGDLFYVFENETADGFTHSAYCQFYSDLNEFEFSVNHHSYGGRMMCNSDGAVTDTC